MAESQPPSEAPVASTDAATSVAPAATAAPTPTPTTPELVIPADLTALSHAELADLVTQATEAFNTEFGDGSPSMESLTLLEVLTEGVEALAAERTRRESEQTARDGLAAELASRARALSAVPTPVEDSTVTDAAADAVAEGAPEALAPVDATGAEAPVMALAAGATPGSPPPAREIRINLSGVRHSQPPQAAPAASTAASAPAGLGIRDVLLSAGGPGASAPGAGITWMEAAEAVDRRLTGFSRTQFAAAAASGRHVREQHGVVMVKKPFAPGLVVKSDDFNHVDSVIRRAVDQSRLPGGSLVASGGWCAPAETIYDLCGLESRDGLFSLPEIGVARGGIKWTTGPNFSDVFGHGFSYNDVEISTGDWSGSGGGSKPVYKVECPNFRETRLGVIGLAVEAGLLQQHGYPELIARTLALSLIAHDHRVAGKILADLSLESSQVSMSSDTVGVVAPLLSAIEKQSEHMRYANRLARGSLLEAIFPFWVRGAIRSDLALRSGVNLLAVSDAQIGDWFAAIGINPQFVYNWQDLNGAPGAFTQWPTTVKFLLYPAGTWVKGGSEIITIDTLFDSVLLGTNEYSALFTEESYLVAKVCHDSRIVTVPIEASGTTGAPVPLDGAGIPLPAFGEEAAE